MGKYDELIKTAKKNSEQYVKEFKERFLEREKRLEDQTLTNKFWDKEYTI